MRSLLVFITLAVSAFGAPVDAGAQGQQGALANGGLAGAAVNGIVNAAVKGVDADIECNDIGNDVLNNANVDILRRGGTTAVTQGAQQGGAQGLVAAVVNAIVNAGITGVDADILYNNILNNVLNNLNIDILRRDGTNAAAEGYQGAAADGGLVGAAINGIVNAGVTGVKAVVTDNNVLNDVGNNLNVDVLKRTTGAVQGAQQGQANGGLAGATVNAIVNAVVTGVKAFVADNNIGNGVLNNVNVSVLSGLLGRRSDGPVAVAQGSQGAASAGAVAASANLIANVAAKVIDLIVKNNNILNGVLNNANVDIA